MYSVPWIKDTLSVILYPFSGLCLPSSATFAGNYIHTLLFEMKYLNKNLIFIFLLSAFEEVNLVFKFVSKAGSQVFKYRLMIMERGFWVKDKKTLFRDNQHQRVNGHVQGARQKPCIFSTPVRCGLQPPHNLLTDIQTSHMQVILHNKVTITKKSFCICFLGNKILKDQHCPPTL